MTQPPPPTAPFAQHPWLAELVTTLGFQRYLLFLTGLLYEESGGPLRRATAVASRDGDLVAYDAGEVVEPAGHLPTSRLFDDDLTRRSPTALVEALAERNQAFFAHEVAGGHPTARMLAPLASLRDSLRPPLTRVASQASKLAAAGQAGPCHLHAIPAGRWRLLAVLRSLGSC